MAVGGRKDNSYLSSLEHGNDFLFDFTCSPCERDSKNKEAIKFCIECGEYLCGSCLNDHNKFAKLKTHQIVDPSKRQTTKTRPTTFFVPKITISCEKHHGKVLDMFCGDHNEVCCAACMALDHGLCKIRHYIPHISKDFKKSAEFKQQEADGQNILSNLVSVIERRQTDIALYKTQRDAIYDQFKKVREDIFIWFNEIEKNSVDFVEKRFQQNVSKAMDDIKQTEMIYKKLQSNKEELKNETDDSQAFVLTKKTGQCMATAKEMLSTALSTQAESFDFIINEDIRHCLRSFKNLGCFTTANTSARCEVFSVQDKDERNRCDITGLCQLQNGDIIVVDAANQSVKRLGPGYIVNDKCRLPSQPWSVCNISNTEIAVSLCNEKKIQFLSVNGKMKLLRSFSVKDTCTGLASIRDILYVGLFNRKQIQMYDYGGFPEGIIDLSAGVPWSIAVSMDSKFLYVASRKDGIFWSDLKTKGSVKIDVPWLNSASSLALTSKGNLLVSCQQSNRIVQYTNIGCNILLTKLDGVAAPQAIFYDQKQRLFVASEHSDVIRVYSNVDN